MGRFEHRPRNFDNGRVLTEQHEEVHFVWRLDKPLFLYNNDAGLARIDRAELVEQLRRQS
jgi:hypothetical protein